MSKNNGKQNPGPPFAVIGSHFNVVPRNVVLEMLEKNALEQGKADLTLGPKFRAAADAFREWSKDAEPGAMFQAPEIRLSVIRLSAHAPIGTWLSEEAAKQMQAAQTPPEVPNADPSFPRIAMP